MLQLFAGVRELLPHLFRHTIGDEGMASLANLLPGQILAVYYSDDVVWHERLLLWRHGPDCWFILTPDLDLYAEDLGMRGEDGPSRVKVKGQDFKYWSRVGGTAYRFSAPVSTDDSLRSYIRQAFREGLKDDSFDREWRPEHVVDVKGLLQQPGQIGSCQSSPTRPTHGPHPAA